MADNNWLNNLKAGDKIGYHGIYNNLGILFVTKITKTQIVTQSRRFKKCSGFQVNGNDWEQEYICELTEDFMRKFMLLKRKRHLRDMLQDESFDGFDLLDIENMIGIMNKYSGDKP